MKKVSEIPPPSYLRRAMRLSRQSPWNAGRALIFAAALALLAIPVFALTPSQPELPKISLTIGDVKIAAEVADEPDEKTIGLMGRTNLEEGCGMLFVFSRPQPMGFWMRDTLIPLSIAYINGEGIIREIHDMQPLDESGVNSVFQDLVYALEVPQGWFEKHGILAGDKVTGLPARSKSD